MSERDPRNDPRPGDIIRFGGQYDATFVEVLDPHGARLGVSDVAYISDGRESSMSLQPWREWTASAEVVKRGDEPAPLCDVYHSVMPETCD